MFDRNEKKKLLIIVLVALVIRLFLMVYLHFYVRDHILIYHEAGLIAKSIVSGEGFSSPYSHSTGPTAWLTPVYPYILAIIFKIFGVFTKEATIAALTFNCITSALTCIPLYYISKTVFDSDVGYVAAATFALYPPFVWYSITLIWNTAFFTCLAVIVVYWLYRFPQLLDFRNASLYGLFIGFVAQVNPVILAYYPFILIWLYVRSINTFSKKIQYITLVVIMSLIALMPWFYRNYTVFDHVMIRSPLGAILQSGNNPETWDSVQKIGSKALNWPFFVHFVPPSEEALKEYIRLGEMDYIDKCYQEAIMFIRENPWEFLELSLMRFNNFWFGTHLQTSEISQSITISLRMLFYILPLPFMIAGIFLTIVRREINALPLMAYIFFLPMVYYFTWAFYRYRYPVEPIVLILSSYGLCSLIRWRKNKSVVEVKGK